ncbi:unnamed protein product [Prorocentrum cordatum]|uniref:Uncharacterized protein n=1 Tax=Prorocentrum cordatum TaxID=2364126 RepID=A0ABN9TJZ0_9DINO|nr:unnamed protein product [Polarella glacialis]
MGSLRANVRADDPGFFRRSYRGERSPPRRALGAAGEGEDREDSPGQGADSPPLGNLPPREQSSCQLGTPPGGRRRPASYVRAHGPSIRETDGVLRTFAQRVPSKPAWTHREAFLAALGPLEPFTTRRGSRAEASDALGPVWASRGQPGASRGGGPGQPADERKGGEQEKSRRLGNGHQHQHRGLPPPGADDPGFGAGGHRSATQEARNLPPSPRSKPPYLGGSTPPTVNTLFRWCQPPGLRQVGRAGQWRQTAAALRAPWRRPRREEPSRLCWLVSTTTHALCILTGGDQQVRTYTDAPQALPGAPSDQDFEAITTVATRAARPRGPKEGEE